MSSPPDLPDAQASDPSPPKKAGRRRKSSLRKAALLGPNPGHHHHQHHHAQHALPSYHLSTPFPDFHDPEATASTHVRLDPVSDPASPPHADSTTDDDQGLTFTAPSAPPPPTGPLITPPAEEHYVSLLPMTSPSTAPYATSTIINRLDQEPSSLTRRRSTRTSSTTPHPIILTATTTGATARAGAGAGAGGGGRAGGDDTSTTEGHAPTLDTPVGAAVILDAAASSGGGAAAAMAAHSYSETEWWGWIILATTWIVFVVGMGSCLGVWSWAWDVGETPYAPPELEDDPTLPIVGYYPALIVMTGVMAWVWVVVAWVGMKYFRHAKVWDDGEEEERRGVN